MKRSVLVIAVLAIAVGFSTTNTRGLSAGRARRLPQPWANLPSSVANRAYATVAELPGTPLESDSLRDIRRWPRTMAFDGVQYELQTRRGTVDIFASNVDPNVPNPGGYYEACYVHPNDPPYKRMGPAYVWLIDSTLVERSYRTSSGGRVYSYDAKQTLRQFKSWELTPSSWLSCVQKSRRSSIEEWFGKKGQLVALQMDGAHYWRGVERTGDDYFEIWHRWFQTLPARGRLPALRLPSVWDSVPEEIRPVMHVTVVEVPSFPGGGESLDDPRRWPATWLVDGQVYRLFYVEYGDKETREGLRHFQDIRSRSSYGAYYSPNGHRDYHVTRGPAYAWRADGTLVRREFRTNTVMRNWLHDTEGRLLLYSSRNWWGDSRWPCARRPPLSRHVTEEWYSPDGELVGFLSELDRVTYWKGLPVSPATHADSLRQWIPKRDPTSWNSPHRI